MTAIFKAVLDTYIPSCPNSSFLQKIPTAILNTKELILTSTWDFLYCQTLAHNREQKEGLFMLTVSDPQ